MNDTTPTAAPATLNEQQLFDAFVDLTIKSCTFVGRAKRTQVTHEYVPNDYMREGGAYGEMADATEMLADYLCEADEPEEALDTLIDGVKAYADQLKQVLIDFRSFKSAHLVESRLPVEAPEDPAQRESWGAAWDDYDNNPRFHGPALTEGEAA